MLQENYFRLSLILNSNSARTVRTNIIKIIEAVLYSENNNPLTISEIANFIKSMFDLQFTSKELLDAIKKSKPDKFECRICNDYVYNTFKLTPKEFKKVKAKMSTQEYGNIINEFLIKHKNITYTYEEMKNIILDFLYKSFSCDAKAISSLLGKLYDDILSNQIFDDIENNKKIAINEFLNWDNEEKNIFVYNAISCGFEYCMLGLKKDNKSFNNMFSGKVFYLDSNIIFRLMGLNKQERKDATESFIKKCLESKIKIKYTNFTYGEIKNTIEYHVKQVKHFYGNNEPLSRKAIEPLSGKFANIDFIDAYGIWAKDPLNKVGDYESFEDYLIKSANDVLSNFKMEPCENFDDLKNKKKFDDLVHDLDDYKMAHSLNTYESNIRVDVNNYLFIIKVNKEHLGENALNINYYMISADHKFIDWAKIKIPNTIPIIVLPSVWYSIILKFNGRADNDYKAFTQFLIMRINEKVSSEKNMEILCRVIEKQEPSDVKEDILFDIQKKLNTDYKNIDNAEEIVTLSTKSVVEMQIESAAKKIEEKSGKVIEELRQSHTKQIEKNSELNLEKGRIEKEKQIYNQITKRSKKQANLILVFFWIVRILFWIIPFGLGLFIAYITYKNSDSVIIKSITFTFGPLFSSAMNLLKGEKYSHIKKNTNKQYLIKYLIEKQCKEFMIDYDRAIN